LRPLGSIASTVEKDDRTLGDRMAFYASFRKTA
jgi:hypothetical protein